MQCGFPPKYVLDEMEMYEVNAAMKHSYLAKKDAWEQARLVAYVMAQSQSTKRIEMEDIVKFYWEGEEDEGKTSITKEEIEALKAQAEAYIRGRNKQVEKRDK